MLACVGQTFGMARAGDSAVRRCSSIDHVLLFCWGVLQKLGHGGFEGGGLDPRMGSVNPRLRQLRFQQAHSAVRCMPVFGRLIYVS
jgi:hypothetical protein